MRKVIVIILSIWCMISHAQTQENIVRMETWTTPFLVKYYPKQLIRVATDSTIYALTHATLIGQSMKTVYDSGWYKSMSRTTAIRRYQLEVTNDEDNGWTIPFTISSSAVIIYANTPLSSSQWSGVGTTTLTVSVTTKKYDKLTVLN